MTPKPNETKSTPQSRDLVDSNVPRSLWPKIILLTAFHFVLKWQDEIGHRDSTEQSPQL